MDGIACDAGVLARVTVGDGGVVTGGWWPGVGGADTMTEWRPAVPASTSSAVSTYLHCRPVTLGRHA